MSTLTIDRTDVDLLTYVLDRPMGGSGVSEVDLLSVEICTADGQTGLGFSYVIAGGGAALKGITERICDRFLVGQEPAAPQAMWRKIVKSFNRTGAGWNHLALTAIDVALWDLHAKSLGVPLGIAMGGEDRQIPVYASGPFQPGASPEEAADTAVQAVEAGFRGIKPRANANEKDAAALDAVCAAIGDRVSLMVDVNEKGTVPTARRLLDQACDLGVLFVEEPLPSADLGGFRYLADAGYGALVATGEHLQTLTAFEPYLSDRMAGVLQPDLAMVGGLTPVLALADASDILGPSIAPHFLPGLFVHVGAARPAVTWLEDFPLLEPLFDGMPQMDANGFMRMKDTPGHGLTLSDRALSICRGQSGG